MTRWTFGASRSGGGNWDTRNRPREKSSGSVAARFNIGKARSDLPVAVELACQELLRLWKQRPEFGPVTLLYVDDPISRETSASVGSLLMRSGRHPNIESALRRVAQARDTTNLLIAFIVEDDGNVVWSGPELLREIDARKDATVGEKPWIAKAPPLA